MFRKKEEKQPGKRMGAQMGRSAREQKRKTGGLRFGLRAQMLCGLLGIFAFSVAVLSWISGRQLTANREAQIARELSVIRENTEIHVRQLLILNEANNDEESFQSLAEDMVQELGNTGMDSLAVCSRDGELLAGRLERPGGNQPVEAAVWPQDGDLREAVAGNAAFTLLYEGDTLTVLFSMPVSVEGKTIGIIRGGIDYSALWQQGRQMEGTILRATVLVFTAAFILIALFLSRILKPVGRLAKVSRQMTLDLQREEIHTELLADLADSGRRDEIGELSRDYSAMLSQTGRYISRVQEDRNRIRTLLESRQEFYNNVTHELKTPLTTIQGYAQLIEADRGADRELLEKGIGHILHESTRLHHMVVELLEMADRDALYEPQPVRMDRLIRSVAEAMEIKANRYGCSLRLYLAENLTVPGVEERLRQIFINLIDNAVKYGESKEVIRIVGRRRPEGALFYVENRPAQRLAGEELEAVFEPFYRADKNYSREQGSSGLGLSICRKITGEHGGRIWAENTEDGRVRFYVFFPWKEEKNEE